MTAPRLRTIVCSECGGAIEICAFCERAGCGEPVCYRCLRVALREELRQPHAHGG